MVGNGLPSLTDTMHSSQTLVSNNFLLKLNRLSYTKVDIVESTDLVFNVDQATTIINNYLNTINEVLSDLVLTEDIINVYEQRNSLSDISICMQETIDNLLILMTSLEKIKSESEATILLSWNPLSSNPSMATKRPPFFQRLRRRSEIAINIDILHAIVAKVEQAITGWNSVSNLILNLIERISVAAEWAELNYNVIGDIETEINACNLMLINYQKPEELLNGETFKSLSSKIFHFNTIQNKLKHLQASLEFLPLRLDMFERKANKFYTQAVQDLKQKYDNLIQRRNGLTSKIAYASTIFGSGIWLKVLESICLEANQLLVLTERSFSTDGDQVKELVSCFDILDRASNENILPIHLLEQKQDLDSRWILVKGKLSTIYEAINNTSTILPVESFEENSLQPAVGPVSQGLVTLGSDSSFNSTHSPSNSLFSDKIFSPGHSCKTSANSILSSGGFVSFTSKSSLNSNDQDLALNQSKESCNPNFSSFHTAHASIDGNQQPDKTPPVSSKSFDSLTNSQLDDLKSDNNLPSALNTKKPFYGHNRSRCRNKGMFESITIPFLYESFVESYASTRLDIKSAPMVAIDASSASGVNSQGLSSSYLNSSAALHNIIPKKDRVKCDFLATKSKKISNFLETSVLVLTTGSQQFQRNETPTSGIITENSLAVKNHILSDSETIRPSSPVPTDPPLIQNGRPLYFRSSFIFRLGIPSFILIPGVSNFRIANSQFSSANYTTNISSNQCRPKSQSKASEDFSTFIAFFVKIAPSILSLLLSQTLQNTTVTNTPNGYFNYQSSEKHFSELVFRKDKIIEVSC